MAAKPRVNVLSRVEETRVREGLSRSKLARLAEIAAKTIKRIEEEDETVTEESKNKLVKGFNKIEGKLREYTYEYLFPNA